MPNPLFDTLNTSSLRIFPTTLSKAAAVSTNVSCTFRHLPFGALSFLSKTSFFFTLPQRQTYPSVPAKTPPLSKTFDDPLIKLCGRRRSWMITLFSAWLPHPLFPNWHSKENFLPNQKWRPREATNLKMPFALVDVHSTRGRGIENGFREAGVGESLNSLHTGHTEIFFP